MEKASKPMLTVALPCLNEAETIGKCIDAAQEGIHLCGIDGEILIADNGSTDGSQQIVAERGARSIHVKPRGYGSALLSSFSEAKGDFVLIADADGSYDLRDIPKFANALQEGADFVIGSRFPRSGGNVLPGAMPFLHYWLGTPILSFLARLFFGSRISDINCGMRAFNAKALNKMNLRMTGMEIASEIVIKAALLKMNIKEVPITLHPAGRTRPPHLRTWRDGWRHLRMMLLFSPRWLFAVPGLFLFTIGFLGLVPFAWGHVNIGEISFGINTMLLFSLIFIIGFQLLLLGIFAKTFVVAEGLLPGSQLDRIGRALKLEFGIIMGTVMMLIGITLILLAVLQWKALGFGDLATLSVPTREVVFGVTFLVLGFQLITAGFFLGILNLGRSSN